MRVPALVPLSPEGVLDGTVSARVVPPSMLVEAGSTSTGSDVPGAGAEGAELGAEGLDGGALDAAVVFELVGAGGGAGALVTGSVVDVVDVDMVDVDALVSGGGNTYPAINSYAHPLCSAPSISVTFTV